jgi:S-adenosylmethionine decarboxylase
MKHILFTLKDCNQWCLDDELTIRSVIKNASDVAESTMLALNSHKFQPQGVTCVAMLAESHISIHTWPELGMAVCDVFTCGDHTKPEKAVEYMRLALEAKDIICNEFVRPLE